MLSRETPVTLQDTAQRAVLEVRGVTKRYGSFLAVADVSFSLERGQVLGMLGPNGAGKTTIICTILGLVHPDAGHIRIAGIDARQNAREALRHVGALIESPTFYPYLTGRENLRILALLRNVPEMRITEVLELVGLAERAEQRVGTYSLGMRQRLAIAAAILHHPLLLILDEPTNGLDPHGIVEVRELIRGLAASGQTILLCSHVLAEVQQVCSHVLILDRGRVVAQGAIEALLAGDHAVVLRTPVPERVRVLCAMTPWLRLLAEDGNVLHIAVPSTREEEFAQLLLAEQIPVLELSRRSQTLERLFLETTSSSGKMSGNHALRRGWLGWWRMTKGSGK
ncbi:ABC transporter ATP-binding protein NatA [bacterium HR28]|nr:ABC transporter ATP-binding protein NatA [bacterium HR28]